jgi:hypothetical protein
MSAEQGESASAWHVARAGRTYGPISDRQLFQLIEQRKLQPEDLLWRRGFDTWQPAKTIPGLFGSPKPDDPPALETPQSLRTRPRIKHAPRGAAVAIALLILFAFIAFIAAITANRDHDAAATIGVVGWRKIAGESSGTVGGGTVLIDADRAADEKVYHDAIRVLCARMTHCYVKFWADETAAPKKPGLLSDAELDSQTADYSYNSTTNHMQFLWNCELFKRESWNDCLSQSFRTKTTTLPAQAPAAQSIADTSYVAVLPGLWSHDEALAAFAKMKQAQASLFADYQPSVQPEDREGRTWQILRIGPVKNKDLAVRLCAEFNSLGGVPDCLVMIR